LPITEATVLQSPVDYPVY